MLVLQPPITSLNNVPPKRKSQVKQVVTRLLHQPPQAFRPQLLRGMPNLAAGQRTGGLVTQMASGHGKKRASFFGWLTLKGNPSHRATGGSNQLVEQTARWERVTGNINKHMWRKLANEVASGFCVTVVTIVEASSFVPCLFAGAPS